MASSCEVCGLKIKSPFERADCEISNLHKPCWKCVTCGTLLDVRSGSRLEPPEGSSVKPAWYCRPHYNKAYKELHGTLPRGGQGQQSSAPGTPSKPVTARESSSSVAPVLPPSSTGAKPSDSARDTGSQPDTKGPSSTSLESQSATAKEAPQEPEILPSKANEPAVGEVKEEPARDSQPQESKGSAPSSAVVAETAAAPEPKSEPKTVEILQSKSELVSKKEDKPVEPAPLPADDQIPLVAPAPPTLSALPSPKDITESPVEKPERESPTRIEQVPHSAFRSDSPEPVAEVAYVPKVGGRGLANQALAYADVKPMTVKAPQPRKPAPVNTRKSVEPTKPATPPAVSSAATKSPESSKPSTPEPKTISKQTSEVASPTTSKEPTSTATSSKASTPDKSLSKSSSFNGKPSSPNSNPNDPPVFKTRRERETWEAHQAFLKRQAQADLEKAKEKYVAKPIKTKAQIRTQAEVEATRKRLEEMGVSWRSWDSPEAKLSGLKSAAFGDVVAAASTSLKDEQLELDKERQEIERKKREAELAVAHDIYEKPIEVLLEEAAAKHRAELEMRAIRQEQQEWMEIEEEIHLEALGARVHPFRRFEGGTADPAAGAKHQQPAPEPDIDMDENDVLGMYGGEEEQKKKKKRSKDGEGKEKKEKKSKSKDGAVASPVSPAPQAQVAAAAPAPQVAAQPQPAKVTPAPSPAPTPAPAAAAAAPKEKKGIMGLFKKLGKK